MERKNGTCNLNVFILFNEQKQVLPKKRKTIVKGTQATRKSERADVHATSLRSKCFAICPFCSARTQSKQLTWCGGKRTYTHDHQASDSRRSFHTYFTGAQYSMKSNDLGNQQHSICHGEQERASERTEREEDRNREKNNMINAKYSEIEGRKRRERRGGREEVVPKNRSSLPHVSCKQSLRLWCS